jgi:DNA topoisomerase III
MSRVYIAEKPSQATDIAKILGIKNREDGYLVLTDGSFMTWAYGHLVEQAMPEQYRDDWKQWKWDSLPIAPETWILNVANGKTKQFNVIKALLKQASEVVIATDAGREGEMIARELLDLCKFKGKVLRLWLSSLVDADIRKALANLLDGAETFPLYQAALARSHADFVYGMTMTRAVTLAARQPRTVFPMGRVKTPTLAMVVKRDLDIENFNSKTYYEIEATVNTQSGHTLKMLHAPAEDQRLTDKATANAVMKRAEGGSGPLRVETKKGRETPPLPFNLSGLQKEASASLKLSAAETLTVSQGLYEKKLITYPRTDCSHLSSAQKPEIAGLVASLRARVPSQVEVLKQHGIVLRDSLFDDTKLTDHHGIIPTTGSGSMTATEEKLYRLITVRFLQAVAPDKLFEATRVDMDANGVAFKATGRVILDEGWSAIKL